MFKGYSVSLPFIYNKEDGPFALNKNIADVVKQNLRMLILTEKGERIMLPDFGVGLNSFIFENFNETTTIQIQSEIKSQVNKYMPFVSVASIDTLEDPENLNKLIIKINFLIPSLSISDTLII